VDILSKAKKLPANMDQAAEIMTKLGMPLPDALKS
jgi:hypothetical protein